MLIIEHAIDFLHKRFEVRTGLLEFLKLRLERRIHRLIRWCVLARLLHFLEPRRRLLLKCLHLRAKAIHRSLNRCALLFAEIKRLHGLHVRAHRHRAAALLHALALSLALSIFHRAIFAKCAVAFEASRWNLWTLQCVTSAWWLRRVLGEQ